tara:strand:- start:8587 stop:9912 length:1326 start_codon:yes stop_codon:yes gene_type:complete
MAIDISKLFSDITGPANTDLVEGTARLNAMDTPGGMAALLSPQRARAMRQGLGGLFGDPAGGMTPQEQVPEAMRGLDINDPNSIAQVIRKLNAVGATKEASQLKLGLDQLLAENANAAAELLVKQDTVATRNREADNQADQVLVNETNAATAEGQLAQEIIRDGQDVIEADEAVRQWNLERNDPTASTTTLGNSTPASVAEYLAAHRAATTPEGRDKAFQLLREKPQKGWIYKKDGDKLDSNGNQAYYQYPAGAEEERINDKKNARISAGHQQRRSSLNVVNTMGRMIEQVESGDIATGVTGILWKLIPGTKEFSFQGDLSVVLANLGYEGLMAAKSSSESGASGFGQLTEKELELLQSLDADLKSGVGMDEATLIFRLNQVQESFQFRHDSAKTDWTIDEIIGRVPTQFPDTSVKPIGTIIANDAGERQIKTATGWEPVQ